MLLSLHVRDMALIDQADVEFGEGLNILTGETGAGKSILIDAVNLGLGQKANRDMIRSGRESASVELLFSLSEEEERRIRDLEIEVEDGMLLIRRKISEKRSEIRVNDQAVTLSKLRKLTEELIDIHGQHEHQSLLREGEHLHILDTFLEKETGELRRRVSESCRRFREAEKLRKSLDMDEASRKRELDFLRFEIREIEEAEIREGEEESLLREVKRAQKRERIERALLEAKELLENAELSRAVGAVGEALSYDESLKDISDSLYDLESIAEDSIRELDHYLDRNTFDEEELHRAEERLDLIRRILMKYGGTEEKLREALSEKKEREVLLTDYEERRREAEEAEERERAEFLSACEALSRARKEGALLLSERMRQEMQELGFLDLRFELSFSLLPEPGENGMDAAQFVLSLNPGEPLRPLTEVASGGELSRIMLSIKTVMAERDEIPTLIFDEIDSGISGRTAERVSEKLRKIARNHQVILITHLPQIAAKADRHFLIEKSVSEGKTRTGIRLLTEEGSVLELSRLLSGGSTTEAALANARELKALAKRGEKG